MKKSPLLACIGIILFTLCEPFFWMKSNKVNVEALAVFVSLSDIRSYEVTEKPFGTVGAVFPDPNLNKLPTLTPLSERPGACYGCHNPGSPVENSIATIDDEKYYHHPMGLFARKGNSPRAPGTDTAEGQYPGRGAWDLNGQLNCLSCHTYHESNEYCEDNDNNNFLRWNFKNDSPEFCITCHPDKNTLLLEEMGKGHRQQKQTAFTYREVFNINNGWQVVESKNCMFCHYIHDGTKNGRFSYDFSFCRPFIHNHMPGDYIPPELDALIRIPAKVLLRNWADDDDRDNQEPKYYEDMCYGCHGKESIVMKDGEEGSLLRPDIYFSHRYAIEPDDGKNPKSNMTIAGTLFPVSDGDSTGVVDDYGAEENHMYCGSCHDVHNAAIKPYLRGDPDRHAPYKAYSDETYGFCQGCHQGNHPCDMNWIKTTHPLHKSPSTITEDPLYKDAKYRSGGSGEKGAVFDDRDTTGKGKIICLSCHNVHAAMTNWEGSRAKNSFDNPSFDIVNISGIHGRLLVIDNNVDNGQKSDLCVQCHQQRLDGPHLLPNEKGECAVCHSPHNGYGDKIWASDLKDLTIFGGVRQLCYSCHDGTETFLGTQDYNDDYGLPGAGNVFRRSTGADHVMHGGACIEAGPHPEADSLRDEEGYHKSLNTEIFPLDPNDWDTVPERENGTAHGRSGLNYASGGAGFYCGTCHNVHKNGGGAYLRYKDNFTGTDNSGDPALLELSLRKTFCSQCHGLPHAQDRDCMECHAPHGGVTSIEDNEETGRLILNIPETNDTKLFVDDDYPDSEDSDGDNEFRHIQAAVVSAWGKVVIVIHPGMYSENINFLGKAVTLKSLDPNDPAAVAATLIDGNQSGSVVTFHNSEGKGSTLCGLTLQNGRADKGGGIYCASSSPNIIKCIIRQNSASSYGGGVYCSDHSSPAIINSIITGNSASNGGGIYCSFHSYPIITNCSITENSADYGGGIQCTLSSPSISNCTLSANSAASYGGGVYYYSSSGCSLTNCTIMENSATIGGGGIRCINSSPIIVNCTITGNSAPTGSGIHKYSSSQETNHPDIKNCILWENYPNEISGTSLMVTYSDIRGGYEGIGNIDEDPSFADAEGRLSSDSPCIDGGTDQGAPDRDMDGLPRPINPGYDMGAYEFSACPRSSLITFYQDVDGDGYGTPQITSHACYKPPGFSDNADDCNDSDPNINPEAQEVCDFIDNNCNEQIDEEIPLYTFYEDNDGDGFGNPDISIETCKEPPGYTSNQRDCYDGDPNVNPDKITIITTDNVFLHVFQKGRNLLKTLEPSCSPYTSFDLLFDFEGKGDILTFQYRNPQSRTFQPSYWFFERLSGKEFDLHNDFPEIEADKIYVIDKEE